MARRHLQGGYACEFVNEPAKELQTECSICLQILQKPDMVSCCGEKFCHNCIEKVLEKNGQACPHCNNPQFTTMSDKKLERELNALKVYCINQEKGCVWSGYLRDLDNHCNTDQLTSVNNLEGCEYEDIRCNKCEEQIQRSNLEEHISNRCEVECRFKYAGCKVKTASKDMKNHLQENMAVHLSLVMELTRDLSNDNARMSEYLAKLTTEIDGVQTQQKQHRRGEVVLRTWKRGLRRQIQQHPGNRRQGKSLILWTSGALVILLLSMLTAHNKDTLIKHIRDGVTRYRMTDNFADPSEISLMLGDLEDQVSVITRDINSLKQVVSNDKQMTMEELADIKKAIERLNSVSQTTDSVLSQLQDELKLKLSTLSSDLSNLGSKIDGLASNEALRVLQQRVDALAGLQRDIDVLKGKLEGLPRPHSRDEITAIVTTELDARRQRHGHRHGGCRGHH